MWTTEETEGFPAGIVFNRDQEAGLAQGSPPPLERHQQDHQAADCRSVSDSHPTPGPQRAGTGQGRGRKGRAPLPQQGLPNTGGRYSEETGVNAGGRGPPPPVLLLHPWDPQLFPLGLSGAQLQ